MSKTTTHSERIHGLHARLSGHTPQYLHRSHANTFPSMPNPLFLATLHAAARHAKGFKLSRFETRAIRMLGIYSSEHEIAEYGKIYTEMKHGIQSLGNPAFTSICLQMDEETAYTEADMVLDAQIHCEEILARPENKVIDVSTLRSESSLVDSEEYAAALARAGSGVTVITGCKSIQRKNDEHSNEPVQKSSENKVKIQDGNAVPMDAVKFPGGPVIHHIVADRFKCHRKQDDSWTGPRNEVYWCFASGADSKVGESQKTGEYGAIETGDVRSMGQSLFAGQVAEHLALHIECWEADDSSGGFYNKLIQALKDVAQYAIDAAVQATEAGESGGNWGGNQGDTGTGAAILALVAICGALVAELLAFLTNDDDFIFRRELAFTKQALMELNNTEISFMFDGGKQGKHELWLIPYIPI